MDEGKRVKGLRIASWIFYAAKIAFLVFCLIISWKLLMLTIVGDMSSMSVLFIPAYAIAIFVWLRMAAWFKQNIKGEDATAPSPSGLPANMAILKTYSGSGLPLKDVQFVLNYVSIKSGIRPELLKPEDRFDGILQKAAINFIPGPDEWGELDILLKMASKRRGVTLEQANIQTLDDLIRFVSVK